jgi:hypothetical protein
LLRSATTTLTTNKGTISHTGTSAFTVTATRNSNDVETLIEYSEIALDEFREMVAVLLTMLEELEGEKFVTSCFARYAQETNKKFMSEGNGRKLVIIRGE